MSHTEALKQAREALRYALRQAKFESAPFRSWHVHAEDAINTIDAALSLPDPLQVLADTHAALDLTYENTTPSRSKRMAEAGFTQRDTRLTCDDCGKKYTPQMLPIHGCNSDEPSPAPVVPQGWKLVPIEPTREMFAAAGTVDDLAFADGSAHGADIATLWEVMCDAAPTAPHQAEGAQE